MVIPLWVWIITIAFMSLILMRLSREDVDAAFAALPVFLAILVFMAFAPMFLATMETMEQPPDYNIPPCPGAGLQEHETRAGRYGDGPLIEQYQEAGWDNIKSRIAGRDGFWSSTYTVVSAECLT